MVKNSKEKSLAKKMKGHSKVALRTTHRRFRPLRAIFLSMCLSMFCSALLLGSCSVEEGEKKAMEVGKNFLTFRGQFARLLQYTEKHATRTNKYQKVSLKLASNVRKLEAEVSRLRFQIESLKSQNNFLEIQLGGEMDDQESTKMSSQPSRSISSVGLPLGKKDLVKYEIYRWKPSQMVSIAEREFENRNYEKSAQFFKSFLQHYSKHPQANDQLLFQLGIASYEIPGLESWGIYSFQELISSYPNSKYYCGAKLWMALIYLREGKKKDFFNIVGEFERKYRNTVEWSILSKHYEKIVQNYSDASNT